MLLHGIGSTRDDFRSLRPRLEGEFDILSADLPGHGQSPALEGRPTVEALTDAVERDLDALGLDRVHLLGNSLGGRIALELAKRHRGRSVVAIAPSGMGLPPERAYQGLAMGSRRVVLRGIEPLIRPLSNHRLGRDLLLHGLRSRPGDASPAEARSVEGGFAHARRFWSTLWWAVLSDLPEGLGCVDCPVILAQGTLDVVAVGQTPRYLFAVPGSRFRPLVGAGHAPQSDSADEIAELVREAAVAGGAALQSIGENR